MYKNPPTPRNQGERVWEAMPNGQERGRDDGWRTEATSGGLKAAIWFRRRRRQGCGGLKVAIWNYFLVDSESRLSKELDRPSLAWCLELASSRLKEGATTDDKRKQRSGSLKAAKLVSVRKQCWAGAIASRRPRCPLASWCYGAARPRFWRLASWNLELDSGRVRVRHRQPSVEGPVGPLVPWCFNAARPRFWRLASWNLELGSSRVRKRRWALAAVCQRPRPSCSSMHGACFGAARVLEASKLEFGAKFWQAVTYFGAVKPRFWRLASWNLELGSSHVRQRR